MSKFPIVMRSVIKRLGISDSEAARRCGLDERRFNNYLNGHREPKFDIFLKICDTFGLSPNQALGYEPLIEDLPLNDPTTQSFMAILAGSLGGEGVEPEIRDRLLGNIADALMRYAQMLKAAREEASEQQEKAGQKMVNQKRLPPPPRGRGKKAG